MPQGLLPYELSLEPITSKLTAFAGLPVYLDMAHVTRLAEIVRRHAPVRGACDQGFTDSQMILTLILLNLAGGECVDDVERLEGDRGLAELVKRIEFADLPARQRKARLNRWRRDRERVFPSPTSLRRYLKSFHDPEQEALRPIAMEAGRKAFIPERNDALKALYRITQDFLASIQDRAPVSTATLDIDATIIRSDKKEATFTYKGDRGYQPLNVYWAESDLVVHTEFRDGNVPANYRNLEGLQEALDALPPGVKTVAVRSDGAAYQRDLLRYLGLGKNERFGVIDFSISMPVCKSVKSAIKDLEQLRLLQSDGGRCPAPSPWTRLAKGTGQERLDTPYEWAEISHHPEWLTASKRRRFAVRFFALRTPYEEQSLPGLPEPPEPEGSVQGALEYRLMSFGQRRYKVFALATNRKGAPEEIIHWHRARCGKGEEIHSVLKSDLAGGKLPSGAFGANAAWWLATVLSHNLNATLKRAILGPMDSCWLGRRLKAIRYHLIQVAGRLVHHGRRVYLRLCHGDPGGEALLAARRRIESLA